jgi:hypothetical protein
MLLKPTPNFGGVVIVEDRFEAKLAVKADCRDARRGSAENGGGMAKVSQLPEDGGE